MSILAAECAQGIMQIVDYIHWTFSTLKVGSFVFLQSCGFHLPDYMVS